MKILFALICFWVVMVSTGCQPDSRYAGEPLDIEASPAVTRMTGTASPGISTPQRFELPAQITPEHVPPTGTDYPATGEVPAGVLEAILKDAENQIGTASDEISVIQAQAVVWGDGSLGCPQPGMAYTQSTVNGYWVVLEAQGKPYDYRATTTGYFFLCEAGVPPISPGNSPDT